MEKKASDRARKYKLLQEILQNTEKRIADFHADKRASSIVEDDYSSDSDTELSIYNSPSVTQHRLQQSHVKTSLQAMQELTNLHILESEVNIMLPDPIIVDEPQVRSLGVWREVLAECRLDLIPFAINFYVHTPSARFDTLSYRNLKVSLVKAVHEKELAKSVLAHATTPSEAVEVLRRYSTAHRSRRTTLARLVDKYNNLLFMQPTAEGGYTIKCAGLLEVYWMLQNKWSFVAPFNHHMRFDLEYMDESYINTITQYHRQLSDPLLETHERTALLCKIINTCLEAKGKTQELHESMESDDPETAQTLRKRRVTLDQEIPETELKTKTDNDFMAPPKSLPRKSKVSALLYKKNAEVLDKNMTSDSVKSKNNSEDNATEFIGFKEVASGKEIAKKNVDNAKLEDDRHNYISENCVKSSDVCDNVKSKNSREDIAMESYSLKQVSSNKEIDGRKENFAQSSKDKEGRKDLKSNKDSAKEKSDTGKNVDKNVNRKENLANGKSKDPKNTKIDKILQDGKLKPAKVIKKRVVPKCKANKEFNIEKSKKILERCDKHGHESATKAKVTKNVEDINIITEGTVKSVVGKNKKSDDIINIPAKKSKIDNTTTKIQESNVKIIEEPKKSINNAKNITKNSKILINNIQNVKSNIENNKNVNNDRFNKKFKGVTGITKVNSLKKPNAGITGKEISTDSKASKIPQKLTKVASTLKKNPLRISPRKMSSNMKTQEIGKTTQKYVTGTNIPRLLKEPVVK